jgi:hypothetical protein
MLRFGAFGPILLSTRPLKIPCASTPLQIVTTLRGLNEHAESLSVTAILCHFFIPGTNAALNHCVDQLTIKEVP